MRDQFLLTHSVRHHTCHLAFSLTNTFGLMGLRIMSYYNSTFYENGGLRSHIQVRRIFTKELNLLETLWHRRVAANVQVRRISTEEYDLNRELWHNLASCSFTFFENIYIETTIKKRQHKFLTLHNCSQQGLQVQSNHNHTSLWKIVL